MKFERRLVRECSSVESPELKMDRSYRCPNRQRVRRSLDNHVPTLDRENELSRT